MRTKAAEYNIKGRVYTLGKKLKDLCGPLEEKGFPMRTTNLISTVINGTTTTDYGLKILDACNEIVSEWEAEYSSKQIIS